jgi:hypothetical protein
MDLKKEIKTVKIFLDIEEKYGDINSITYQALKLKYEALTTVPTTIQKTMTPAQLYASDSPLWAYNYTEADIRNILERLKSKPKTEESFNTVLAIIANDKNNGRMMFDEYGNIRSVGGIHGNRLQIGLSQKHNLQKINNNIERN